MSLNQTAPMRGVARTSARGAPRRPTRAAQTGSSSGPIGELFSGVTWTPAFIAFLYYLFVIITFYTSGADIAAVACVVLIVLSGNGISIPKPLVWFGAFLAWSLLTVVASPSLADSWQAWWTLAKVAVVALCCVNVVRTRKQWIFLLSFVTGCFLLFPFRGAMINYVGGNRVFGRAIWNYVYANPNDLAAIAILFAAFSIAIAGHFKSKFLRMGCYGCASAFLLLVFFTQSRGALLGIGITGIVVLAGMKQRLKTLLSFAAIAVLVAAFAPSSVWDRLGGLSKVSLESNMKGVDQEGSAEQRFQIMQVAAAIAADHPLLGVGIGTYPVTHAAYAAARSSQLPLAGGYRDAHNTYLRLAAETGLTGLTVFFLMIFSAFSELRKIRRQLPLDHPASVSARWLGMGLLAYLGSGLFGSYAYLNVLYIAIAFVALLPLFAPPGNPMRQSRTGSSRGRPRPSAASASGSNAG